MKLDLNDLERRAQAHRQASIGATGPLPDSIVFAPATLALIARVRELEQVASGLVEEIACGLPGSRRNELDDERAILAKGIKEPTSAGVPPDAMVAEMLPCPFCGRADLIGVERHPEKGFLCVRCRACGAIGPSGRSIHGEPHADHEAMAHWNRRKPR